MHLFTIIKSHNKLSQRMKTQLIGYFFSDAKEALSDKQLQENMFQKSKMSEINMWIVMFKNVENNTLNFYLYHNIFGFVVKDVNNVILKGLLWREK